MIKVILVIWIGLGNTQALSVQKFETMEECESAKAAISVTDFGFSRIPVDYMKCIPYAEPN